MDVLTPEQRRKNMQRIRCKDTKIEVRLRKALWHHGYRYRKNFKELPGRPDIVLTKYRIAIFCDSEFFHGKDWPELKAHLLKGNNSDFWISKIHKNIDRDAEVDRKLKYEDWIVIRFWGSYIQKHLDECVQAVDDAVVMRKSEDTTLL